MEKVLMKDVPCYRLFMIKKKKANLAFRTGFISAGDFAEGIVALQQDTCDVIVDDVTYITEPFFQDGIVSKAVNYVKDQGCSLLYFCRKLW